MSRPLPLSVYDRKFGRMFQEYMDDSPSTYESRPRRSLSQWLESSPTVDWIVAGYQNTRLSARKIDPFILKHKIDMSEFEPGPYKTYADFFDRRFLPGKRNFPGEEGRMGAFAEARYFAWERVSRDMEFPVKGASLDAATLLGNGDRARMFEGGPVVLARLAPVDYHHLHYFDDGITLEHDRLGHRLWTVNRNALQHQPDILFRNERSIHVLETRHFGRIGFVEIGALSVGRIVQKHDLKKQFKRGDEKSAFRFGGSAVVMVGEPGAWQAADDLLERTKEGVETLLRLGEPLGHRT
jgi:phosphatidylserine decarboxylase